MLYYLLRLRYPNGVLLQSRWILGDDDVIRCAKEGVVFYPGFEVGLPELNAVGFVLDRTILCKMALSSPGPVDELEPPEKQQQ